MTRIRVAAATHRGRVRSRNEDHFGATGLRFTLSDGDVVAAEVVDSSFLAIVADGLGGHSDGHVASGLVVDHILGAIPKSSDDLSAAIRRANQIVMDAVIAGEGALGMGATVVAVLVGAEVVSVVNVGDSSAFAYLEDRLVELSVEDSPDGSASMPGISSSIVTQSIGGSASLVRLSPHVAELGLEPMRVLLCTDGLTDYVARSDIKIAIASDSGEVAIERLIALALTAGAPDNVTCLIVDLGESQ